MALGKRVYFTAAGYWDLAAAALQQFAFNLNQMESEPEQARRWAYGDFAFDPVYRIKSKTL